MDFLEIRRKAKERAASRAREAEARPGPSTDPVVTEADILEGALMAELRGDTRARPPALPFDPLSEFFFDEGETGPAVPELGLSGSRAQPGPLEEERREYLAFFLGSEEYALEIHRVREIVKAPPITEVPRAPAHILGVVTVRGEVIAVFDPHRQFGLPPPVPGSSSRIVVCDAGDGPIGLLVDRMSQVVRLPPSAIESKPQGIGGASAEYIVGVGRQRDRLFILLDLAALVRRPSSALEATR